MDSPSPGLHNLMLVKCALVEGGFLILVGSTILNVAPFTRSLTVSVSILEAVCQL